MRNFQQIQTQMTRRTLERPIESASAVGLVRAIALVRRDSMSTSAASQFSRGVSCASKRAETRWSQDTSHNTPAPTNTPTASRSTHSTAEGDSNTEAKIEVSSA